MSSLTIPIQNSTENPSQSTQRWKKKKQNAYRFERKEQNSPNPQIVCLCKKCKRVYNKVPKTSKSLTKL